MAETAESRPYAWPTQGPPSEDDIAMPPPPDEVALDAPLADPARARRRRLAVFAVAALVAGGAAYLALKDRGHDAPPSATITASAPESAAVTTAVSPESAPPAAVPAPDGSSADEAAARAVRDVMPAAGTPADAVVPPPPAMTEPPAAVAAITTTGVTPPPIDRLSPPPAPAAATPTTPEPSVAARPAGAGSSLPEASGAKDAAAKAPVRSAAGRYAVQLASVGSKQRAQAESVRLGKRLASALGGRKPRVEPAEIAGRGTVYRIRVPGFASRGAARNACAKIKAGGGDCLVVRN